MNTSLTYDSLGAGELTQVTLPYGGHFRWAYQTATYAPSSVREVASRYLQWDTNIGERNFAFSKTTSAGNLVPATRQVLDGTSQAIKTWTFSQSSPTLGLATTFAEGSGGSGPAILRQTNYAYSQDAAGNNYVSRLQVVSDPGTSSAITKQTDQTVDSFGNVTQSKLYDYTNLISPSKTYNTTYLTNDGTTDYTALYIRNRPLTVTLTDANNNVTTLVQNTYDQYGNGIAATSNIYDQDTADYGTSFTARGNVSSAISPGSSIAMHYDQTGTAIWAANAANTKSVRQLRQHFRNELCCSHPYDNRERTETRP